MPSSRSGDQEPRYSSIPGTQSLATSLSECSRFICRYMALRFVALPSHPWRTDSLGSLPAEAETGLRGRCIQPAMTGQCPRTRHFGQEQQHVFQGSSGHSDTTVSLEISKFFVNGECALSSIASPSLISTASMFGKCGFLYPSPLARVWETGEYEDCMHFVVWPFLECMLKM